MIVIIPSHPAATLFLSAESHSHDFGEVKHYEVVRPVRLHSVRKRHADVSFSSLV